MSGTLSGARRLMTGDNAVMTFLTRRGEGPAFPYAGEPMHVLVGDASQPAGFAASEIAVPAGSPGPVPHAHDEWDEALYVLDGRLLVWGDGEPLEAGPGSMFTAPRGHRHGFSNPFNSPALVLGIWAPGGPALALMREVGAALQPGTPPDPAAMRDLYARHASRMLP
jgi:mannose-6-phosphate isomerase-like protein (cupin superfamily)